jgi:DNA recombination protein RmuC
MLYAICLLAGVIVGAALVLVALQARLRAGATDAARRLELERELARASAELERERAAGAERALVLEQRERAVEQLLAPLKEQLGRVGVQLQELDRDRREARGRLEAQLRALAETGERLRSETGALVTALRRPNARGQWGQMQLRKVVELAGMVKHCDFTEQAPLGSGDEPLRPDLVVNLPGGKQVVVDAKAPLQGVLDAYEAREQAERERHLREHAAQLRRHVRALADKAYWADLDAAPDFVVLFLPGEHLYGAALEADPALIEDAMARRVLIATPTTLVAMLRAVAYGWQQERVAESARAIAVLGRELHARVAKLAGLLATLGNRLNGAVKAYNEAVGSYEARVIPGARRLAEHGAAAEGRELPALEPVTLAARSLREAEEQAAGEQQEEPLARTDEAAGVRGPASAGPEERAVRLLRRGAGGL